MVEIYRSPEGIAERAPDLVPLPIAPRGRLSSSRGRTSCRLTETQLAAIRAAMQLFVDDDVAKGVAPGRRLYCDACERARPAAGFIQYQRYFVCNECAIEYEIARARGLTASPGQYVRDKNFGETACYALDGL